jgi:hypothetical protein
MFEGVFVLRKKSRLVEKFSRLEMRQTALQGILGHVDNGLQQR